MIQRHYLFWFPRIALLAFTLWMPALAMGAVQVTDPVDAYLKTEMMRNHIPGLSVAIVRNGKIIKLKAYGQANLEWSASATQETAFPLASATKPLTATALMLLVQDGKLALDAPISRYLGDSPPAWSAITIRHLASHTSGIPDDLGQVPVQTAAEGVSAAAKLPLDFMPGARASYGISGYIVLMHIIERVTGKPFDIFLRERLFDPLGMNNTRFGHARQDGPVRVSTLVPHRAAVYEWNAADGEQKNFSFLFPPHTYSAGGLYSSAADLAKWAASLDTGTMLTAASREQMWTAGRLADGTPSSFGLGWVGGTYRARKTVGHSGGPALADILRFVDDKLTIIVLANQQKMYPYLAQGVADLYVASPTVRVTANPVSDTDTATTSAITQLLRGFSEGTADPAAFAQSSRRGILDMINGFVMPWFRSLGPPSSVTLIEDIVQKEPQKRVRRYRVWYGKKPVLWKFELDAEGKILGIEPTPE